MPFDIKRSLPIEQFTLGNGLEVISSYNPKSPIACLNLAYKVGSKNENPQLTGLAHLFEHLMFEGSKNIPKGMFDRYCSLAGGSNNAFTTYDLTCYHITIPSHQIETAFWLESDRLLEFAASQTALDTQIKVVTEEILQTVEEQPYGKYHELLLRNSFSSDCYYNWDVQGAIEHVGKVRLDNALEFYNKHYAPNNAYLVLSGDITPEKAFALAEKYFGEIPSRIIDEPIPYSDEMKLKGRHELFSENVPMNGVFLACHLPGASHKDTQCLELLSDIIGYGKSSRLYSSMIAEKNIASSASSNTDFRESASFIKFYAIANDNAITCDNLYQSIIEDVVRIKEEGPTGEEVIKARNQTMASLANYLQYSNGIAIELGSQCIFYENPKQIYQTYEDLMTVSVEDIIRVAREYLIIDEMVRIDAVAK